MPSPPSLAELRQLIAARFPTSMRRGESVVPTGVPAIDEFCGGLPGAAFTELVGAPSGGSGLVLASLLEKTRHARQRLALLDATDTFAPDELPPEFFEHVVWARGGANLKPLWAVADLLLRDPHFAVAVMDLRGAPERDLLRTPGTTWYRLQRAVELSGIATLVLSPTPLVPCARHRFRLETPLQSQALAVERVALIAELCPQPERTRGAGPLSA